MPGPALSVVIVAYHGVAPLRRLMDALASQTIRERLELVFVTAGNGRLRPDAGDLACFARWRIVELDAVAPTPRARAAGAGAAGAPLVVFAEDHCFPAAGWAEALVLAHQGPWAAVGPAIGVANPQRYSAWANALLQYGPWMQPAAGREVDDLPGHNSSYKRDLLAAYGDDLVPLLTAETMLHRDLRRRGHRLWLDPAARADHVFVTRPGPFVVENYHVGRQFAASRTRAWRRAQRLAFAAATPLIPLVRLGRILRRIRELGWTGRLLPGVLPWLALGLTVSAAGELMGTLFGLGLTPERTVDVDFRRDRYVSDEEREAIWGTTRPT